MGRYSWIAAVLGLWVGFAGTPVASAADTTVIVLGMRSLEGDDEFARNLTGALRSAASQVPSWALDTREVSLSQMALAHGCDEPDAACMANVAGALGVQGVLYGTTRRTGAGSQYDYSVSLHFFNAATGQIEGSVADTIPRVQSDIDDLKPRAERYVRQFAGGGGTGTLRVTVNVPAASVQIDGERVGATNAEGTFEASVPSGRHRVEVDADGHTPFSGTVSVVPDEEAVLEVTLDKEDDSRPTLSWPTYTSLGLGLVFGSLTLWSGVFQIKGEIEDDLRPYRLQKDKEATPNVCRTAEIDVNSGDATLQENARRATDACDRGNTMETVWVVFLGLTVAAAGSAAYFLYRDLTGQEEEEGTGDDGVQWSLRPSFGPEGGSIDATLRF